MIQNLCRSFTAALLLGAVGMPLAASAEQPEGNARANLQETLQIAADQVDQTDVGTAETVPADLESARSEPTAAELSDRFRITAHTLEGQDIAVLHVNNLPVLTFVDQSEAAASKENGAAIAMDEDATRRAETVARQIDAFQQAGGTPEAIDVLWDEDLEEYVITLDGEQLVMINDTTRYPNSTGQLHADALQATNRLRNLLGATENLTEIEGAPEPAASPGGGQGNWGVSSSFTGRASWYGPGFHGRHTASGEVFNQNGLTAAHRTLPFGTRVRVTNVNNNRQVIVRINDRGPFSHGRVIDLSAGAAREIGLHIAGVGTVHVEVLAD